ADAGVVHQDVERRVLRRDPACEPRDRRFIRHIERDELRTPLVLVDRAGDTLPVRLIPIRDVDERAGRSQRVRDRFTYSRSRAGHQRGFVVQSEHEENSIGSGFAGSGQSSLPRPPAALATTIRRHDEHDGAPSGARFSPRNTKSTKLTKIQLILTAQCGGTALCAVGLRERSRDHEQTSSYPYL